MHTSFFFSFIPVLCMHGSCMYSELALLVLGLIRPSPFFSALSTLQIALQKDDLQQINSSFSLFENEKGQQKLLCDYNFISFAILLQHVAVAEQYHLFPTLQEAAKAPWSNVSACCAE